MSKSSIGTEPVYDARTLGKSRMFILGLQHMFAMFGATVLVPALSGLDVATRCCSPASARCCSTC